MDKRIITLDGLVRRCGYFNGNADVNNGYGCDHPEQEDIEEGQGRCFDFSCPLGISLHPETEPLDREYFSQDETDVDYWGNMSDGTWMLLNNKEDKPGSE